MNAGGSSGLFGKTATANPLFTGQHGKTKNTLSFAPSTGLGSKLGLGSSSSSITKPKVAGSNFGGASALQQGGGDDYAFDIDLTNVKRPSTTKKDPPKTSYTSSTTSALKK